jgi:hypothetical protein
MQPAREEQAGIVPAVLTCVAGMVGLIMVAAGPWLLLG